MSVVGLSLFDASPASAASPGDFSSRINALRASKGLSTLATNGSLAAQAQSWAQAMADVNKISHNPNLGGTPGNWTKVGENVGTGPTVDSIFDALVASPGHYRNMVEAGFNSVGVGIAVGSDGRIYTCHVFAAFPQASTPAPSSTQSAPKSSPTTATPKAAPPTAPKAPAAPKSTSSNTASTNNSKKSSSNSPATTSTTAAPQHTTDAPAAGSEAPPAPAEPALPAPSLRIVTGLAEVGSLATQG